ncbi:hypothetical protein ACFWCP_08185, partial [Streptomyces diastaticus]|uniref:hypothetical protein n=1 Tax=Streptomyces diastaticus TaxID=1956 RepID=UPI00367C454A
TWIRPDRKKRIFLVEEAWHIINSPFVAQLFQRLLKFGRRRVYGPRPDTKKRAPREEGRASVTGPPGRAGSACRGAARRRHPARAGARRVSTSVARQRRVTPRR